MPETVAAGIIAVAGASGTAATAITVGSYAAFLVGGAVVARRQQRKALRDANANLQDRRFTVRGSAEAKNIVFGRTRVGGVQGAPGWTHGTDNSEWTLPIFFAGHEIDGFEQVWFGEEDAQFASTAPGTYRTVTNASKWARTFRDGATQQVSGGSPSSTVTISSAYSIDSIAYAVFESTGADSLPTARAVTLQPGTDYSVARAGNDLVVTWLTDQTGRSPVVTYTSEWAITHAYIRFFHGSEAGERDLSMEANSGGEWTSTDVGKGIARLHLNLLFNESVYPTGAPQVSAVLRGAKLYDPRLDSTNGGSGSHRVNDSSTWSHSGNPALCWAWYMMSPLGLNVPPSRINWPSVITAAHICDEDVELDGGGTQNRYECHGVLSTSNDIRSNVDAILSSMAGIRYYSGGQWYVRAGAYVTPTVDLDENDFAGGEIRIMPRTRRRELFNSIRGKFVDGRAAGTLGADDVGGLWALTDFPSYSSPTYVSQDNGEELWSDIELPMTTDWRMAQRIALLILNRHRQALTCNGTMKFGRTYKLQPGDTFRLTSPENGWTNKVFRVVDRSYSPHGNVDLVFQEEAYAVYSWSAGDEAAPDPAPNTRLPDPRIIAPLANFSISTGAVDELPDGTRVPYCEASWDEITDSAVVAGGRIEFYWKRAIDTLYRKIEARPTDTSIRIEPVSGGDTINAYAVVVNGSQVRSLPVFATVALDSTLPAGAYVPPLSANLVRNAALNVSTAGWSGGSFNVGGAAAPFVRSETAGALMHIPGSPSNAYVYCDSSASGNGPGFYVGSGPFTVTPSERIAFGGELCCYGTDGVASIAWFDAQDRKVGETPSDTVVAGTTVNPAGRFNDPANYSPSRGIVTVPDGASLARLTFAGYGNWSSSVSSKHLSIFRPFAGVIPQGATDYPPWDGGSQNAVDTDLLKPGAATTVYRLPAVIDGPVNINTVGARISDVVKYDDLRGFALAATVTFDYTIRNRGALAALIDSTVKHILIDGNGTQYESPPRTIFKSGALPVGHDQTMAMEVTHRWEVSTSMPPPYTFRVSARDKFLLDNSVVDVQCASIDYGVEVIKR